MSARAPLGCWMQRVASRLTASLVRDGVIPTVGLQTLPTGLDLLCCYRVKASLPVVLRLSHGHRTLIRNNVG